MGEQVTLPEVCGWNGLFSTYTSCNKYINFIENILEQEIGTKR